MFKFRFNYAINQCTKLISHSQIVDQNDNNKTKFILCHKLWTKITTVKFISYFRSKLIFALSYSIIRSYEIGLIKHVKI